jgi:predicted TIM-barrel fold metal-dependent hydrolase
LSICVDAHTHVYETGFWPPAWFDYVATQWAARKPDRVPEGVRGRIEPGMADTDGARMLAHMDAAGVDVAVILTVDWELGMESVTPVSIDQVHEHYAGLVEGSNGRLRAFAGVDPRRPDALDLLARAWETGAFIGVKLYPPAGFYPYSDEALAVYRFCLEHDVPAAVHSGETLGLLRPRFANPLYLQDVQRQFPDLKLMIAHAGATWWWEEAVAVAEAGVNTCLELSSWQHLAQTREGEFVERLRDAMDRIGSRRMFFGSDHISGTRTRGLDSYERWVQWFRTLATTAEQYDVKFSEDEVNDVLGASAAAFLGLPA